MDDVHPDRSNTHNRDLNQILTHISCHMQAAWGWHHQRIYCRGESSRAVRQMRNHSLLLPSLRVRSFITSIPLAWSCKACLIVCREAKSEIISPLIFSIFHISHSSYLYPFLFTYLSISRCFCWFSRIERRSIDKHKRASTVTHATMRRLPTRNSAQNCS